MIWFLPAPFSLISSLLIRPGIIGPFEHGELCPCLIFLIFQRYCDPSSSSLLASSQPKPVRVSTTYLTPGSELLGPRVAKKHFDTSFAS